MRPLNGFTKTITLKCSIVKIWPSHIATSTQLPFTSTYNLRNIELALVLDSSESVEDIMWDKAKDFSVAFLKLHSHSVRPMS